MRNQLQLTDEMADFISSKNYRIALGETNSSQYIKFKKCVLEMIETVLTKKQRKYLKLRYFEQLKVIEIAKMCEVSPSTVTRGIQGAIKRLGAYAIFLNAIV